MLINEGTTLDPSDIWRLALGEEPLELSAELWDKISAAAERVYNIPAHEHVYGVNTGFGALADISIPATAQYDLQANLIRSHAVGFPPFLDSSDGRAVLLCRIIALARGVSGVRPELVKRMILLFNKGVAPAIPAQGSLGASGDLGPLSSMALLMIGEGRGYYKGCLRTGGDIHTELGLRPLPLSLKEGLSLINGTSATVALACSALVEVRKLFVLSLLGCCMMLRASGQSLDFLKDAGLRHRPHRHTRQIAKAMRAVIARSGKRRSRRLQPPYSYRVAPLVLATIWTSVSNLRDVLRIELASATDNPLMLSDGVYHGAHFHGIPIVVALDYASATLPHLTTLLDRQVDFALDPRNEEVPSPFLATNVYEGKCGMEGAQYLLTSLHIENVAEAGPFGIHSLPTNAGNQDVVSLSYQSALRYRRCVVRALQALDVYILVSGQLSNLAQITLSNALVDKAINLVSKRAALPYRDESGIQEVIEQVSSSRDELLDLVSTVTKHEFG